MVTPRWPDVRPFIAGKLWRDVHLAVKSVSGEGGGRMELQREEAESADGPEVSNGTISRKGAGLRSGWTIDRILVIAGFVAMVLAVVILATADPSLVVGLFVLIIPGIIFTGLLVWRPRPWTYLIAGVADCLLGIIALPIGLLGALGNPLVGPVYSSVVLAMLSILLALPAGIIGYLRGRTILRQR